MFAKTTVLAIGLAGALAATGAIAQTRQADKDSQKFIKAAIQGDIAEVDVGKLAQEKGQTDAVKQYGAMLVKDHGEHKSKAEQVAGQLGVEPPTGSSLMQKATYAKLKLLSGTSFDRSFAKSMVKDHADDIKEYKTEASKKDAVSRETDHAETVFTLKWVAAFERHTRNDARLLVPSAGRHFFARRRGTAGMVP
jgi:putative membrane protein